MRHRHLCANLLQTYCICEHAYQTGVLGSTVSVSGTHDDGSLGKNSRQFVLVRSRRTDIRHRCSLETDGGHRTLTASSLHVLPIHVGGVSITARLHFAHPPTTLQTWPHSSSSLRSLLPLTHCAARRFVLGCIFSVRTCHPPRLTPLIAPA